MKKLIFILLTLSVSAIAQEYTTFNYLYALDDVILGETSADSLTVNAATTQAADVTFSEDVTFGDAASDKVTFTSYIVSGRVGTGSTPGITIGADDWFVEGTLEVDSECQLDGILDANSTSDFSGDAVFNEDVQLCIAADDKVTFTSGYFTRFRVGTGATAGITLGDDDVFIEGTCEIDDECQLDGILDANSTSDFAGDAVFNEDVSLAVAADDKVTFTDGYFTQFRIGTGATPDITLGADDAFIEGSLEADGVVSISAGAVGAPALYSAADSDTGLWWSAADTMNLSVGGAEVAEFGATANSIGNASDTTTILGGLRVGTGSTPGITLGDDDLFVEGTAEIDGVVSVSAGAVGAPSVYGTDDTDTGIWWSAADTLNASVDGAEVLELGATANTLGNASDTTTVLGALRVGTGGTPDLTLGDDDFYVEGTLEVDAETQLDGAADFNSTADFATYVTTDTVKYVDGFDYCSDAHLAVLWDLTGVVGAGTNATAATPGWNLLTTGGAGGPDSESTVSNAAYQYRAYTPRIECVAELGATSGAVFRFGFYAAANEYVEIMADSGTGANWYLIVDDTAGADTIDSGVAVTTDPTKLEIQVDADGTPHWWIDDVAMTEVGLTNKMTASAHYLRWIITDIAASAHTVSVDYVETEQLKQQ
jgi:hypothetical protein